MTATGHVPDTAAQPLVELHDATVVLGGARVLDGLTLSISVGEPIEMSGSATGFATCAASALCA